jgi:tetratricopeptide (TPR) repeat protein
MIKRGLLAACVAAACLLTVVNARTFAQADAQSIFKRGVSALHLFEYEEANEAFAEARRIDPGFVMAYWGEAMTYHQTLWRNENVQAAREVLAGLGPSPAARRAKTGNPKEQALLDAVAILFADGDAATRRVNYADAMGRLFAREPEDPDVASFYALALLGTMSRSLIGFVDAHEGHSQSLAGSPVQGRVASILADVLRSHPEHPGALHYLLHNDDDPDHAKLALDAARTLARMSPESSHARHMPAHIFLQLGLWRDAAASDRAAFAFSDAWVARKHLGAPMRNYHALSWLAYELLQQGRYREAWGTIGEIAPVVKAGGQLTLLSDLSSMRARHAIETADWSLMARESNFGNVDELFAIGVSAARAGNGDLAERARGALATSAQDARQGDLRPAIAIMEREVAAIIALAARRHDEAVAILRAAAQSESQLPLPLGLPEPIKPAPELLGEVLLEIGRPAEAVEFFVAALRRNANRSLSVLGLARSAAAAGDTDGARRHYREFLANFDQADPDLPVLREARAALDTTPASRVGLSSRALVVSLAVLGLVAAGLVSRRFLRRAPVPAPAPHRRADKKKGPVSRALK